MLLSAYYKGLSDLQVKSPGTAIGRELHRKTREKSFAMELT
ncbi:hypothetical protein HMPREF7215_1110 [Pyramidobacter piscolens W5455]|uniref:Uncharacterized protein n=1 Tax=Pyramidobacter piscolens W5455 TaxID=352165 RepID=A0ABM9ZT09_9BACT|nr:hypothetical protein HMPREF7215_1110 [Pyramidobacter piscolens W5455]